MDVIKKSNLGLQRKDNFFSKDNDMNVCRLKDRQYKCVRNLIWFVNFEAFHFKICISSVET